MADKLNPSTSAASPAPAGHAPSPGVPPGHHSHFVKRDILPVPLLAGIFVLVLILIWRLMWPTWQLELNQYMARNAQNEKRYQDAIDPLLFLIKYPSKTPDDPATVGAKNPTYLGELAHSYLQTKDYDNALKYYLQAQENRTNQGLDDQGNPRPSVDFSRDIGRAYLAKGDITNAEKYLLDGLKHNKIDKLGNYTMGELEMKRGNYTKAADYFKVVANDPDYHDRVRAYYEEIEKKLFAGID